VARLEVVTGQFAGTTIEITDELLIGRADADLMLDDDAEVSGHHAIVRIVDGSLEVEDLGSSNGTFVDGVRIDSPTLVGNGAKVTIGNTELVVEGNVPVGAMTILGQPDPHATGLAVAWEHDPELTRGGAVASPSRASESPPAPKRASDRRPRMNRGRLASRPFIPVALGLGALVAIGLTVFFLTTGDSSAKASVIDVPVRFTVEDVNRSLLPCKASGSTYELVGRLVAPSSSIGSSATVYVSGVIFPAQFVFNNKLVPGYDYAREMAELGQTSVVIDRVGYGKTVPYPTDGRSVCMGAQADMLHQVVAAMRSGGYDVTGSSGIDPRAFDRVAVVGYSIAAVLAEVEAASFGDTDALIAIGWATQELTDYGYSPDEVEKQCSPGLPKQPGGVKGYFRTLTPPKVPPLVSAKADQRLVGAFWQNQELDACGQFLSVLPWFFGLNKKVLPQITVPVLIIYGYYDVQFKFGAWQAEWDQFTGTRDRTLIGIPDGHMLMLDRHAPMTQRVIAAWLDDHGF
jgi:pimeloyl-ACP methyl ester carboxylesterase